MTKQNNINKQSLINPYKLFGININSTLRELKKAYYCLSLLCHPDKGGDKEDMDIIHKAYKYVKEQLQNNNCSITYEEAEEEFERFCKEQESLPPPFSKIYEEASEFIHDFNRKFEQLNKDIYTPFSDGYGQFMDISDSVDINNYECKYSNKQYKDAIEVPLKHTFSREVVIYKEPQYLPNTYGKYYNFNVKKIDDFSDKIGQNLEGTDYIKAFSPVEIVEHHRKSYDSVEELLEERRQTSPSIKFHNDKLN